MAHRLGPDHADRQLSTHPEHLTAPAMVTLITARSRYTTDMDTTDMDEQTREAEIEAIKQVVATLEHVTKHELPDEFVSLFRADAIWTTGGGRRLVGRDEISAFTHQVLPGGMKDLSITFEVEHVLFIRPDVAAVKSL